MNILTMTQLVPSTLEAILTALTLKTRHQPYLEITLISAAFKKTKQKGILRKGNDFVLGDMMWCTLVSR
jgi:hypothetical protein